MIKEQLTPQVVSRMFELDFAEIKNGVELSIPTEEANVRTSLLIITSSSVIFWVIPCAKSSHIERKTGLRKGAVQTQFLD